ncbi:hypothetical protein BAZOLSSOX_2428 [uncultured Gammaproteobacteria bacterium]|jgi:hypothetical protein|uniref:Uncharacterized protein n=1 Tax=Bathymodiolus azoricus thioautotrophic gill symbiont TaxID=235205 RepID=A0A1H6M9I9_9GAMM|nr:hypothetical protein [uncultured Gammaproteobacteria bacterium]CAC9518649.1 hypothetical protein [uncultured Gammaproteobacteria bacterium]SEH94125.1 hypothetical protein BAZSYMA_ACONTIG00080_8 [Bathymodiolus azoricus thioautotrophic gill symbiont]VVH55805.1 hypothetical protein BAZOLSSOX_2428 [uncultured Gammaproteobacteria bacterium]
MTQYFYNLDWFRNNFTKYFELLLDEELEINRHVFVGYLKQKVVRGIR